MLRVLCRLAESGGIDVRTCDPHDRGLARRDRRADAGKGSRSRTRDTGREELSARPLLVTGSFAATVIVVVGAVFSTAAHAQSPFVTDDANVAGPGVFHVEVFNEYDWLPVEQTPHLRQNTLNMRLNVGLGHGWEADLDSPFLVVTNTPASSPQRVAGSGDTNFGLKYHVRGEDSSRTPAFAVVTYLELPTGDASNGLGSGLADVWIYTVAEKRLPHALSVIGNLGYLFAGNTSTGVLGIQAVRGHVVTLSASLTHVISDRWSAGGACGGHRGSRGTTARAVASASRGNRAVESDRGNNRGPRVGTFRRQPEDRRSGRLHRRSEARSAIARVARSIVRNDCRDPSEGVIAIMDQIFRCVIQIE